MIIPIAISIFLAGLFNGGMDGISFVTNYWLTKYKFFGATSFLGKWDIYLSLAQLAKTGPYISLYEIEGIKYWALKSLKAPAYYLWLYKPQYVEAFPYSSTFFVFVTQGWHLLKAGQLTIYRGLITYLIIGNPKVTFNGYVLHEGWYIYLLTYISVYIIERGAFTIAYTNK